MSGSIDRNRTVSLLMNGSSVTSAPLMLEKDFTLNLKSSFGKAIEVPSADFVDFLGRNLGSLSGGKIAFSSKFKQFSFQVWKDTDPIGFSLTFNFHLGMQGKWNAKEEVSEPIEILSKIPLPGEGAHGNLIAPGPAEVDALSEGKWGQAQYSLQIGRLWLIDPVLITAAEPTYSTLMQENSDGNAYPVFGMIKMDFSSLFTATKQMVPGF